MFSAKFLWNDIKSEWYHKILETKVNYSVGERRLLSYIIKKYCTE